MPILKEGELDIISHSAQQTYRLGVRLGQMLGRADIVCIAGDMGAGKTVFAAGIGKGWGASETLTSPTFNLVHEHSRPQDEQTLFHLDCYRLTSEADVASIGFDDILGGRGPVLLEWPEHIHDALPRHRLWVELRVLEQTRRNLIFEGTNDHYQQIIKRFRAASYGI